MVFWAQHRIMRIMKIEEQQPEKPQMNPEENQTGGGKAPGKQVKTTDKYQDSGHIHTVDDKSRQEKQSDSQRGERTWNREQSFYA